MNVDQILELLKSPNGAVCFHEERRLTSPRSKGTIIDAGISCILPGFSERPVRCWDHVLRKPGLRKPTEKELQDTAKAYSRYQNVFSDDAVINCDTPRLAITSPAQHEYEPRLSAAGYKCVLEFRANGPAAKQLKMWLAAPPESVLFPEVAQPTKPYRQQELTYHGFTYCCGAVVVHRTASPSNRARANTVPYLGVTEINYRNYGAIQDFVFTHGMIPLLRWQPRVGLARILLVGHLTDDRKPYLVLHREETK